MKQEKNYTNALIIFISIILIIIGLVTELSGLAVVGAVFLLFTLFSD
jgi:hypothetical protein